MAEFTPIRQALTLREKYEICFDMSNDGTHIKFYGLNSVYQITMREMVRYELYQDVYGFDHLNIESDDSSMDYFLRLHGDDKWRYVRSSSVASDAESYEKYVSYLKHDLSSTIDAYRQNFCLSPEENYRLMLESLRHQFNNGEWNPDRNVPRLRLLSEIRKSYTPSNEEVTTHGGTDPDRDPGAQHSDVPGSQG